MILVKNHLSYRFVDQEPNERILLALSVLLGVARLRKLGWQEDYRQLYLNIFGASRPFLLSQFNC